jgi:hypothetical protein
MSSVLKNPALPQHFHTVLKEAEKHSLAHFKTTGSPG